MTTVGYGDVHADSTAGRAIAAVVMIVGIGFVALLTAAAAQRLLRPAVEEIEAQVAGEEADLLAEIRDISRRLQRLEQRISRTGGGTA